MVRRAELPTHITITLNLTIKLLNIYQMKSFNLLFSYIYIIHSVNSLLSPPSQGSPSSLISLSPLSLGRKFE